MTTASRRTRALGLALAAVLAAPLPALAQGAAAPPVATAPPGVEVRSSGSPTDQSYDPAGAGVHRAPSGPAQFAAGQQNDFPTVARADYIFACMQVNGQTRDVLEKCSCSIDVIASLLPFAEYEEAETILSVKQRGGKNVGIFDYGPFKEKVKTMKRAQIEGELRCF
jgi:hypothetical protein